MKLIIHNSTRLVGSTTGVVTSIIINDDTGISTSSLFIQHTMHSAFRKPWSKIESLGYLIQIELWENVPREAAFKSPVSSCKTYANRILQNSKTLLFCLDMKESLLLLPFAT